MDILFIHHKNLALNLLFGLLSVPYLIDRLCFHIKRFHVKLMRTNKPEHMNYHRVYYMLKCDRVVLWLANFIVLLQISLIFNDYYTLHYGGQLGWKINYHGFYLVFLAMSFYFTEEEDQASVYLKSFMHFNPKYIIVVYKILRYWIRGK